MDRFKALFTVIVFGLLVGGWLGARWFAPSTELPSFAPSRQPEFDELVPPLETLGQPDSRGSIFGTVVTAEDEPVPDALIHLRSSGVPLWTHSDEQGRFRIDRLGQDLSEAMVVAWGHPPLLTDLQPGLEAIVVRLGPRQPPPPTLDEIDRSPLEGQVLPTLEAPWADPAGYELVLTPLQAADELGGAVVRRVMTLPSGEFEVGNLALGGYTLSVLPSWAQGGSWPDLLDEEVPDLHHSSLDGLKGLVLPLRTGGLEGLVSDARGQRVEGALVLVSVLEAPGRIWPPEITGPDGRFVLRDLPPGDYLVNVWAGEGHVADHPARIEAGKVTRPGLPPLQTRQPKPEAGEGQDGG